jgi:hypothetical protein
MDIEVLKQLALGVIPPGIFGLLLFAMLWQRGGQDPDGATGRVGALAMGFGFVALSAIIFTGVQLPPASADRWIAPIAAGLGVLGFVLAGDSGPWTGRVLRIPILAFVALVSAPWIASTLLERPDGKGSGAGAGLLAVAGFVVISMATLRALRILHQRRPGAGAVGATIALLGASSQVLVLAFDALKMGQAVGVFAAMLGGGLIVAFFRPGATLRWMLDVPVLTSAAAFFQGYVRGDTVERSWVYLLLIAVSPWMALLPDLGPTARLAGWRSWTLRLVLMGVPLVVALAMAKAANDAAMEGY